MQYRSSILIMYQIACYIAILKRNHLKFLISLDGIKK